MMLYSNGKVGPDIWLVPAGKYLSGSRTSKIGCCDEPPITFKIFNYCDI